MTEPSLGTVEEAARYFGNRPENTGKSRSVLPRRLPVEVVGAVGFEPTTSTV
jgi:hypothetical protein